MTLIRTRISARRPDDDEGVNQVEANSWNNEQVHGGDVGPVITSGRCATAGWAVLGRLTMYLATSGLNNLKAKLEQFAMDARRTPQRIVHADPPDQRPQV